jgi:hypothetical protein
MSSCRGERRHALDGVPEASANRRHLKNRANLLSETSVKRCGAAFPRSHVKGFTPKVVGDAELFPMLSFGSVIS